jgi:hypothetical protein
VPSLFVAPTRSLFSLQKPRPLCPPPPPRRPTAVEGGGFQRGSPPLILRSSHISSSPPWLRRVAPPSPNPRRACAAAPFSRPASAYRARRSLARSPLLPRCSVPLSRAPDLRSDRPPPTRRTAHTATHRRAQDCWCTWAGCAAVDKISHFLLVAGICWLAATAAGRRF